MDEFIDPRPDPPRTTIEDLEAQRNEIIAAGDTDPGPIIICTTCGGALFAADDTCLAGAVARISTLEAEVARLKKGMVGLPRAIVVVPEEEGGYSAEVPSMPGCITCADTWDELLVMITDAQKAWRGEPCEHHDAYVRRAALAGEGVPE